MIPKSEPDTTDPISAIDYETFYMVYYFSSSEKFWYISQILSTVLKFMTGNLVIKDNIRLARNHL
jgi:hypothetical protein